MAHLFETGFVVRQPAWHGLAAVHDGYPESWEEARQWAGLEWEPIEETIYRLQGIDDDGAPRYEAADGFNLIVRSDTKAVLSSQRDSYTLITHQEMGAIVDAVLGIHNVKYETAGVLAGGRQVWCLVYLDEPEQIPGDITPTYPYFAILNSHDGTGACRALHTDVRIVCANTANAAEMQASRSGQVFSFQHSKNWKDRIDEARETVFGVRKAHREWVELATHLMHIRVSETQREQFVQAFIPMPPDGLVSDRVKNNVTKSQDALRSLFRSPTTEPVAHTAYGVVQAAVEYLDHVRWSQSWETKMRRQLLRPEPLKAKALTIVKDVVGVA